MGSPDEDTERVNRVLSEKIESLPSLPKVARRILSLINDDETEIADLERAIRMDQALSAQVLKYANARYFGHERKVTTLKRAISILGFNTLRGLALSFGMENQYSAPESPDFPREDFWNYSLATAICSEIIANKMGVDRERAGQVYSAGQLHACGKAILDQHLHREFLKVLARVKEKDTTMYRAEEEVLSLTHCDIGGAVLDTWNLPDPLVEAARFYYEPGQSTRQTVAVVHLASVLTKTKGFGFSGDDSLKYLDEETVSNLGVTDEQIQDILEEELPEKYHLSVSENTL